MRFEYDCLRQCIAGYDADPVAIAHEQRIAVDVSHAMAGGLDRFVRVDEESRPEVHVGDARAHQRADAAVVLLARHRVELGAEIFKEEERGEARIAE